jgi:hypothetical protein
MTRWIVLIMALPLIGCAAKAELWTKPDASGQNRRDDLYSCATNVLVPKFMSVTIDYKMRDFCMESRGWTKAQPP